MEPVVEFAFGRPHGVLRPHVERYVGYRLEGFPAGIHRGLPSRHLTLIVSIGAPVEVTAMPDPSQPPGSYPAVVAGMHAAPAVLAHDGDQVGIAVEVAPTGARALLGCPAAELASTVLNLSDVLGRGTVGLSDRLGAVASWAERFAILDGILVTSARDGAGPPAEVAWAWQQLLATGGTVPVSALADELGWSRRHFGERFRREIGLSPKVAARVLRFDRASQLLKRSERPGLATVAAMCGYADQAHLTREWNEFAGCPPSAWLGEEVAFVQDSPPAAPAD